MNSNPQTNPDSHNIGNDSLSPKFFISNSVPIDMATFDAIEQHARDLDTEMDHLTQHFQQSMNKNVAILQATQSLHRKGMQQLLEKVDDCIQAGKEQMKLSHKIQQDKVQVEYLVEQMKDINKALILLENKVKRKKMK